METESEWSGRWGQMDGSVLYVLPCWLLLMFLIESRAIFLPPLCHDHMPRRLHRTSCSKWDSNPPGFKAWTFSFLSDISLVHEPERKMITKTGSVTFRASPHCFWFRGSLYSTRCCFTVESFWKPVSVSFLIREKRFVTPMQMFGFTAVCSTIPPQTHLF